LGSYYQQMGSKMLSLTSFNSLYWVQDTVYYSQYS